MEIIEAAGGVGDSKSKLRVCDTCGSYLGMFDNDRRLADHFIGKLHIGYREIREHVAKLQAKRAKTSSSHQHSKR